MNTALLYSSDKQCGHGMCLLQASSQLMHKCCCSRTHSPTLAHTAEMNKRNPRLPLPCALPCALSSLSTTTSAHLFRR